MEAAQNSLKALTDSFEPREQGEGDGAKVRRIIGGRNISNLDPFLMLDLFNVKLPAGFPDHPHRGFETVTYMVEGEVHHEDFTGNRGVIGPGDIQWMTAGKGIVHAEMPGSFEQRSYGFQLWINLEARNKFCQPQYQEFKSNNIPVYDDGAGMLAKVVSGDVFGIKGPIVARTPAFFIDFHVSQADKSYRHTIPAGWNTLLVLYEGSVEVQGQTTAEVAPRAMVFQANDGAAEDIIVKSKAAKTRFILMAGKPLNEPICNYGPFVLSNEQDLRQAFDDFQNGMNGFENARNWRSEIRDMKHRGRSV